MGFSKTDMLFIGLTLAFIAFAAGYFMGSRTVKGTFTIQTESVGEPVYAAGPSASPSAPESVPPSPSPSPEPSAGQDEEGGLLVNINTASSEELQLLPQIGPVLAQRIIDYRESFGGFGSADDIMAVSGIGEAVFEKLKPYIYVE